MAEGIVRLMYQSWADLDAAIDGLSTEQAVVRLEGCSSMAWTVGHLAQMVDSWLNVKFQGLRPNGVVSQARFRSGGSGQADDWSVVLASAREVQAAARGFLDGGPDLDRAYAYDGSVRYLRATGLTPRHAVMRIAAHYFVHVGEVLTIRTLMGLPTSDIFPNWGETFV